jgi:hypothetical protein
MIMCLAIGFVAGRVSVSPSESYSTNQTDQNGGTMISEQEAIELAKARLDKAKIPVNNRQAIVSAKTYKVVFPPPKGALGGNFTLTVDAETGKVLDMVIER